MSPRALLIASPTSPADNDQQSKTEAECPPVPAPTCAMTIRPQLQISLRFPAVDDIDDDDAEDDSDASPEDSDDEDDMCRALAFAKSRAAYLGMSAAMAQFSTSVLSDEDGSQERLSSLATSVISSLSNSPPALERHISRSSVEHTENQDLTELERQECEMIKAFTKRWAANVKLQSTYWQGLQPIPYKEVSVAVARYLTLYQMEQAIRNVSARLNLAPPLEVDLAQPHHSYDPAPVGLARLAEVGQLIPRSLPVDDSAQQKLAAIRAVLAQQAGMKVETVTVRLLAGAKRAAGKQKEAHARRQRWTHGPSKLRFEVVLSWVTSVAEVGNDTRFDRVAN